MSVCLTRDFAVLNALANRPDIYAGSADDFSPACGQVDLSVAARSPMLFLLVERDGVAAGFFMFVPKGAGVWEAHTNLGEELAGHEKLNAVEQATDFIFLLTDCVVISTYAPEGNRAAKLMALHAGCSCQGVGHKPFRKGGQDHKVWLFTLGIDEWTRRARGRFVETGRLFHERIEAVDGHAPHAEHLMHDEMVGLALVMGVKGGQPQKAAMIYNRWAAWAGYEPVQVVKHEGDAALMVRFGGKTYEIDAEMNLQKKGELACQP